MKPLYWMPAFLTIVFWPVCSPALADTQPEEPETVTRIGLLGCHKQWLPAPALLNYVEARPDLALWVGDNVYADADTDPAHIQRCYEQLEAKPAFRQLREQVTFLATWDDHDYGLNNDGKNYKFKEESKELFRKFWRHEGRIPEDRPGVYHADIFGEGEQALQVIMLDGRFNRDDEGDNGDTLGEQQWQWLEAQLKKPARLRLIVSGYQVLLDRDSKFETWAKFPKARKRLFNLIKDTGAEGAVFIAGDQHYGEASRMRDALGYDAIELMFAGINQYEPHVFNSYRVSPVAHAEHAYALIDIQWRQTAGDDADEPHLLFRCFDARTDEVELTYRVNFDELVQPADNSD